MNLQESVDAIRQDLQRLVCHLTGDKRPGEDNHSDGQRDSDLQRENRFRRTQEETKDENPSRRRYAVRSEAAPRVWGPFKYKEEAWDFIQYNINHGNTYKFLEGSEEDGYAIFATIGRYTIEDFWAV